MFTGITYSKSYLYLSFVNVEILLVLSSLEMINGRVTSLVECKTKQNFYQTAGRTGHWAILAKWTFFWISEMAECFACCHKKKFILKKLIIFINERKQKSYVQIYFPDFSKKVVCTGTIFFYMTSWNFNSPVTWQNCTYDWQDYLSCMKVNLPFHTWE